LGLSFAADLERTIFCIKQKTAASAVVGERFDNG
jgi:hypothetical protein